jgi:hypothetical protein
MAVLVGLATILFRNIIIIACVMFSPLALLLWVAPGQSMRGYWKTYSDNFTKALLLFPLMIAIIYGGRIFAWIAGDLGAPGFLDLIMVLVGFFGPYFILPKAFQWGGSWMKAGANAIANNTAVKKGGELGRKELREHMERKQGEVATRYNPNGALLGFRRGKFGVPVPAGRLATRIQAGSFMPTDRGRNLAIAKGAKWKSDRNEESDAYAKRVGEVAMTQGYVGKDGYEIKPGVKAQKQAMADLAYYKGSVDSKKRAGQSAIKWLMNDSNSFYELQNTEAHTTKDETDPDFGGMRGKRLFESPLWESTMMTNPDLYSTIVRGRPDLAAHVLQATYGKTMADATNNFTRLNTSPEDQQRVREFYNDPKNKGEEMRLTEPDRMSHTFLEYMDAGNYSSVAQGLWQEAANIVQGNDKLKIKPHPHVAEIIKKELGELQGIQAQNILGHLNSGSIRHDVDRALGGTGEGEEIAGLLNAKISGTAAGTAGGGVPAGAVTTPEAATQTGAQTTSAAGTTTGTGSAGTGNRGGNGGGQGAPQPSYSPAGPATGIDAQGIIDALNKNTRVLQESAGRASTRTVSTPTGEIKIEHSPRFEAGDVVRPVGGEGSGRSIVIPQGAQYQPGDTVHPVSGTERNIVIPPGTRSLDPPKGS